MSNDISSYENKMKKGHGQGKGTEYIPWTTVRDFASHGLSGRVMGWKTGRIHHFLSQLERSYFYMLEWSAMIKDIREKYPLPLERTFDLSERLGIKHPADKKTKELAVMTTDFVIDFVQNGDICMIARSVIPSNQLGAKRTIERLELERMYWVERDIDWGIVTEREIPSGMVQNIEWVYASHDIAGSPFQLSPELLTQLEPQLFNSVTDPYGIPLAKAALQIDQTVGLEVGSSLWAVQHYIATKLWVVDMTERIEPSKPLFVQRAEHFELLGKEQIV
ncbi:TnsA endonuclease N-terminal domain-containing protein [Paenibacillus sp. LHD-38]|uniref:TnsA endonuclease N-terminal domain-containing protein n=1 Tax=Paenibacillus sp. LHD-38 TaxID=3072143 RepID=UPI00280F947A|nr:TnsA endonuclease N-terminal domain-containing protein [Paenibacillus sp. LHD-38]MDQ8734245.1 TnsA endonuclease N-terminal domain-containing protein [Paenibacillus sp. LHD-38]